MAASPLKAERLAKAKPRTRGRPTKYDPAYCAKAIELGKRGKTWTAIAAALGIARETLYAWSDTYPDFSDALKLARVHAQVWWEDTMQGQARGKYEGSNATAMIFAVKNQFPDDYRDRREIDHSGELKIVELNFEGFDGDDDDD